MTKKKTAKTENDMRIFVCRQCGQTVSEPLITWRKKKQECKRYCNKCLESNRIHNQTIREMRADMPYSTFGLY